MFETIRTERLLIRAPQPDDAEGLWRRRNDPKVAELQSWAVPFERERADEIVNGSISLGGPTDDEWWMAVVCDVETEEVLGDLAIHLTWGGKSVEIGYTFHPEHWGNGYAVESVEALIEYLFETLDVTRVSAMLHPDNRASAQVLERTGFLFEGHTRKSFWVSGEASDDLIYGLLREDWESWRDRPRDAPESVELAEVTADNLRAVYEAATHKSQESFVAPNWRSLVQATMPSSDDDGNVITAWHRAIVADGDVVGFVMLAIVEGSDDYPFLWRLLIDRMHQRRGIAGRALDLVEEEVRQMGSGWLFTSWVPGRGSPGPFYLARGYEPTGKEEDGEIEAKKVF